MNIALTSSAVALGLLSLYLVFWMRISVRRRYVTEVSLGMLQVMQMFQRHRGLSMAILNHRNEFEDELRQTETTLSRSLHALKDQYSSHHPVFATERWQSLLSHWNTLCNNWRQLDFMTNLYAHNEVILGQLGVLQTIAQEQFSLLGPERSRIISSWPSIVEHLGMLRALGMHTLSQDIDDSDTRVGLAISDHIQQARQGLDLVRPNLPDNSLVAMTEALLRRVSKLSSEQKESDSAQYYYADITDIIDRWYRMMNTELIGSHIAQTSKSFNLPRSRYIS